MNLKKYVKRVAISIVGLIFGLTMSSHFETVTAQIWGGPCPHDVDDDNRFWLCRYNWDIGGNACEWTGNYTDICTSYIFYPGC